MPDVNLKDEGAGSEEPKSKSPMLFIVIVVVVLLLAGGYFAYRKGLFKPQTKEMPKEQTTTMTSPATPEVTTTPPPSTIEPPKEPKLEAKKAMGGVHYTVQVSAWRTEKKANKVAADLIKTGLEAYVVKADLPQMGGSWYRVRVGKYATRKEATKAAEEFAHSLESGYWIARATE